MINSALGKLQAVYVGKSNIAFESFLIKWNPILHWKTKINFNHFFAEVSSVNLNLLGNEKLFI